MSDKINLDELKRRVSIFTEIGDRKHIDVMFLEYKQSQTARIDEIIEYMIEATIPKDEREDVIQMLEKLKGN